MQFTRHLAAVATGALALAGIASAQLAISARSGMINYVEGKVLVNDQVVVKTAMEFPEVKEGQELRTTEGRAEVLLTPGAFLRVAENSAFKMISSRLTDTRVQVLAGSVILEIAEMSKESNIAFSVKDAEVAVRKRGVYRVDVDENLIRVYDGEAVVVRAGQSATLKGGRQLRIAAVLAPDKFDAKTGDAFFRWAARRAEYIAMANVSAARSADQNSYRGKLGYWYFNPYFGYFTFLPGAGYYSSFFGPRYYSIGAFNSRYFPPPMHTSPSSPGHDMPSYNSGYGYSTVTSRGSGSYSGSTAPSAPASAPVASPRSGDGATSRGSGGHGR